MTIQSTATQLRGRLAELIQSRLNLESEIESAKAKSALDEIDAQIEDAQAQLDTLAGNALAEREQRLAQLTAQMSAARTKRNALAAEWEAAIEAKRQAEVAANQAADAERVRHLAHQGAAGEYDRLNRAAGALRQEIAAIKARREAEGK